MKNSVLALSAMALAIVGFAVFSPSVQSGTDSDIIIYCEPEDDRSGYIVCEYDSGGLLSAKSEVDCPKGIGMNGEDCPANIDPPDDGHNPPTHVE